MVAGVGNGGDQGAVSTVVHRLGRDAFDRPARAGRIGQRERVDREVGRDGDVGCDVKVRPSSREDAVRPVDEVVAGVGNGGDQGAVSTVVDRLRGNARDRAALTRCVGQRERIDREVRRGVDVGHDVEVGSGGREDTVRPVDKVVAGIGNGCDQGAISTVVHGLRRDALDRPARARRVGQRKRVDREVGRGGDVGHDVEVGPCGREDAVRPVDEVVAGVRHRGNQGAVRTVVYRLGRGAFDRPASAGCIGQRERVDREVRRGGDVGHDVEVGSGGREDTVRPVDEVIAGIGNGCDQGAVRTVIDRLGRGAFDRPARAGRVGQRERVDREVGRGVDVGHDVEVGPRGREDAVRPVDEVIADVRHGRYERAVSPVVYGLGRGAFDRPASARRIGQRERVDREVRRDRDIGHHIRIGPRSREDAV